MTGKKFERRGLGRGLSALMADVHLDAPAASPPGRQDLMTPVELLVPNPNQPRRSFSEQALGELAASIQEKGVIQPLIVRKNKAKPGTYEIIAGERRWRAAQIAQVHEIPVIIRELDDTEVLEVAIIENIQRADLNPVEEAMGYQQLIDRFGHTQEKMAEALSKSRSYIANLMRLLKLPEAVLDLLRDGKLTTGHARALITTENPVELAREIVAKGLSVRETERLAKSPKPKTVKKPASPAEKDADTRALESDLSANLGMKVRLDHTAGQQDGKMTISYSSLEQLDELCRVLSAMPLAGSR